MAPPIALQSSLASSPTSMAVLLIGITTLIFILQKLHHALTTPLRAIPGPWWSHITHYPLKLANIRGQRVHYIHALHQKYGPVVRIAPDEVAIADADAAKTIHRPGSGYEKAAWYKQFVQGNADGMFDMTDAKRHAARRRLFARAFGKSEIRGRWEGMVREKVELAVQRMGEEMRRGEETDCLKWWTFLATDVSGHLMFGESFRMLELGKKNDYIHTLESTMQGSGIRAELPFLAAIGKLLPHPTLQAMFNANDRLLAYGTRAVTSGKQASGGSGASIFAQLDPDAQKESPFPFTDLDIRVEAGNLIVAGADTTAVSLTYLTYAVLARPELRARLEDEVAGLRGEWGDRECEALPLLNAVVNETLRLYGAAPGSLPRAVPPGGATLGGYFLPGGATVSTQAWSLHRDERLWRDAERFDPDRWLSLPPNTSPSSMSFQPFGAGTRICLGLHLALMELRLAAALFFRELKGARLAERTTPESMDVVNYFLIMPKDHHCYIRL
ncbi:putative sterigmatocystin biosynthesis P450 monooxygenase STCB [Lasiodiplodia hormozganensis]|uniref:Sterigmatocystin biosynthesis P450 monooxygenase STCB n=1 Tax=Lasiodiplodia hormozganensis TaxID=869390 RepID=A0AA40CB80_9PEZI|nr:putative sterigmatocystin biosynthesis P450 monooxygenase STCB [Lasiodiplodia hormozganensis]